MKIFIDSAKVSEIEEAFSSGFLDGVTTNPSLLKGLGPVHREDLNRG
jgi:transaldolase